VDHPVRDRLGTLQVPTLIVFGTSDRMIPNPILHGGRTEDVARDAERLIPGVTVVRVPGAGHTVQHDDPAAFHAAADPFLAAHRR
jgi:pimeloyl-ACP methyl ester carboxylesterase